MHPINEGGWFYDGSKNDIGEVQGDVTFVWMSGNSADSNFWLEELMPYAPANHVERNHRSSSV